MRPCSLSGNTLAMSGIIWSLTLAHFGPWPTLVAQILVGMAVYVAGARLLRFECLEYLLRALREWAA
jgi:hypothetical protein